MLCAAQMCARTSVHMTAEVRQCKSANTYCSDKCYACFLLYSLSASHCSKTEYFSIGRRWCVHMLRKSQYDRIAQLNNMLAMRIKSHWKEMLRWWRHWAPHLRFNLKFNCSDVPLDFVIFINANDNTPHNSHKRHSSSSPFATTLFYALGQKKHIRISRVASPGHANM